jgi:murein DD-endopeptidase MepM/ murein hydrolase activator NlpD
VAKSRDCGRAGRWVYVAIGVGIGLAASASQTATAERTSLLPPIAAACLSSAFGHRVLPDMAAVGTFHNGIDLPAPLGSPVRAVAPGTVIRIQRHGVGGLEVLIQHDGFIGIYSHLGLIASVLSAGGKSIYGGEKIATVSRSSLTYGPHLYFGMMVNGHSVDPAPYLDVAPCVSAAIDPSGQSGEETRDKLLKC